MFESTFATQTDIRGKKKNSVGLKTKSRKYIGALQSPPKLNCLRLRSKQATESFPLHENQLIIFLLIS